MHDRTGQTAVIFVNQRNHADEAGYAAASAAMAEAAALQPGYRGMDSVRGPDGAGITVSWWADEASAIAWRRDLDHSAIRATGRARWYDAYEVAVATVGRAYTWTRDRSQRGRG